MKIANFKKVICGIISAMMLTASVPLSTSAGGFGGFGGGMNWGGFGDTGNFNGGQSVPDNNNVINSSQNENMIRIMPAGDSITFGMGDTGGYRKYLDYFLKEKGYDNIDFVGPEGNNAATFNYNGKSVTYDDNHAGYSGYTIKQNSGFGSLYDVLKQKNAIKQANPDIVLLIIGTNDMNGNRATSACEQDLRDLIDYFLEELSSDAMLFVSTIPELGGGMFGGGNKSAQIADYNAAVKKVANEYNGNGKRVTFADIHGCLNGTADLGDGVHPNATGYEKMGKYWAGIVDDYLKSSSAAVTTTTTTTKTTTQIATTTSVKQVDSKEELGSKVSKWGDANCDGSIDMSDAVAIMQALANPNKYTLTNQGTFNADVYEAGSGITTNDAFVIQKYLLGLIKTLPESYSDKLDTVANTTTNTTTTVPEIVTTTTESVISASLNDNFDSGIGNWSGRGAASVEASSDAYYGSSGKSLAVTGRTSEWNGAALTLGSEFKAGQTYSISMAALQLSRGAVDIQVSLQQGDGNSASYTAIAKASCDSGVWTKIENTSFTIPENSGDMVLYVETIEKSGNLMNFYIDDVMIAAEGTKSAVVTGGNGMVPEPVVSSSSQVYTMEELTKKFKIPW
ncbi:MAG: carbohydrate binding domain-containing protein [Ruminococcus sp.]|nr:carbohydrate binding domain-containing protein [Ruminococcus sp.]